MYQDLPDPQLASRFNVNVAGTGPVTLLFVHGFGCNQSMWRHVLPQFWHDCRVVTMDLMGCGLSESASYDPSRYDSLDAYAQDVIDVAEQVDDGHPIVLVGHSVGGAIALLAGMAQPTRFDSQVLIAPSACFANDGDYVGGFDTDVLQEVLRFMRDDRDGWSRSFARLVLGQVPADGLVQELVASLCATHERASEQFAALTFLLDQRGLLPFVDRPTLLLQCTDDALAPLSAGNFMHKTIVDSELVLIQTSGHAPHLTAPTAVGHALSAFLARRGLMPSRETPGGHLCAWRRRPR